MSHCAPPLGVSEMFVLVSQYQTVFTFSIIEIILIYYFTLLILSVCNSLLCYTHCTYQVFLCFPRSRIFWRSILLRNTLEPVKLFSSLKFDPKLLFYKNNFGSLLSASKHGYDNSDLFWNSSIIPLWQLGSLLLENFQTTRYGNMNLFCTILDLFWNS
jgi:hypothetical protein